MRRTITHWIHAFKLLSAATCVLTWTLPGCGGGGGGGGGTPPANANVAGSWDIEEKVREDCGGETTTHKDTYVAEISQRENELTVVTDVTTLHGTLKNRQFEWSGSYTEGGGTTTSKLKATVADDELTFSGQSTWSWTDGRETCTGTTEVTGKRITSCMLTIEKTGNGSGTVTGPGMDCGDICSQQYEVGAEITLKAVPDKSSKFVRWTGGDDAREDQCDVIMNSARIVTAEFARETPGIDASIHLSLPATSSTGTYTLSWTCLLASTNWVIQEDADLSFSSPTVFLSHDTTRPFEYAFNDKPNGRYCYRMSMSAGSSSWSEPACITVTRQAATKTFYPTFDNTIAKGTIPEHRHYESTAFSLGVLRVGKMWVTHAFGVEYLFSSSLLWFDVMEQIRGKTIRSATLNLYVRVLPGSTGTFYSVSAIADQWDPNRVTWNTRPKFLVYGTQRLRPCTSTAIPFTVNVTQIVQEWAKGSIPNLGIMLYDNELPAGDSGFLQTEFDSVDNYSNASRKPQLEITYE